MLENDVYFHETYEEKNLGTEYGDRISTSPSFCGRKMLRLHSNLVPFYYQRNKRANGSSVKEYDVREYPWVMMTTL